MDTTPRDQGRCRTPWGRRARRAAAGRAAAGVGFAGWRSANRGFPLWGDAGRSSGAQRAKFWDLVCWVSHVRAVMGISQSIHRRYHALSLLPDVILSPHILVIGPRPREAAKRDMADVLITKCLSPSAHATQAPWGPPAHSGRSPRPTPHTRAPTGAGRGEIAMFGAPGGARVVPGGAGGRWGRPGDVPCPSPATPGRRGGLGGSPRHGCGFNGLRCERYSTPI